MTLMSNDWKAGFEFIDDGKEDFFIEIDGHIFAHFPEEGYKSLGITTENMAKFISEYFGIEVRK